MCVVFCTHARPDSPSLPLSLTHPDDLRALPRGVVRLGLDAKAQAHGGADHEAGADAQAEDGGLALLFFGG